MDVMKGTPLGHGGPTFKARSIKGATTARPTTNDVRLLKSDKTSLNSCSPVFAKIFLLGPEPNGTIISYLHVSFGSSSVPPKHEIVVFAN